MTRMTKPSFIIRLMYFKRSRVSGVFITLVADTLLGCECLKENVLNHRIGDYG